MQDAKEDSFAGETGRCLNETERKDIMCLTDVIGGHGPWQFRHWAIFFLASLCCSMQLFSTLPLVTHSSCPCAKASEKKENISTGLSTNCHNSIGESRISEGAWNELSNPCYAATPRCLLEYSGEESLPCTNVGFVIYAKCLFVAGSLISIFSAHPLMKRYGRRSVALISCFFLSSCSLAGAWVSPVAPHLVLKIVLSFGIVIVYLISAFSLTECVSDEFRLLYFYTGHVSWGLAHFILPFLVWIAPSLAYYNVILSIPCFALLICLRFLPETPESYASRGLWERARQVMRIAARCNGLPTEAVELITPDHLLLYQEKKDSYGKLKNSLCSVLELLALFVIGFLSSFIYFSSLWLTDWLHDKRSSYFALMGTTEVAAALIFPYFTYFMSARRLWAISSCMSSVFLILLYLKSSADIPKLSRAPYIVEMFFASCAFTVVLLHVLSRPLNSKISQFKALTIGTGFCIGLLGAALEDMKKLTEWNRNILLISSVPNLITGVIIGLIPNKYVDYLHF